MTVTEGSVLVVAALAVVAIVVVLRNRARTTIDMSVGKFRLIAKGSNDPAPGATIEGGPVELAVRSLKTKLAKVQSCAIRPLKKT